jgi:glycosyltransferase involved in cell wall biosynthesis
MKIAFATLYDARDIRRGSGTFYHLSFELERQGQKIYYLGPLEFQYPLISKLLRTLTVRLDKRYITFLDPYVGHNTGRQVTQKLRGLDYDVLLTNDFAIAAYTQTDKLVVLYTDVMITAEYTERNLPNSRLSNLTFIGLVLSRQTIRRGLARADLCIFPAKWSAQEAVSYHRSKEKIHILPFGANLEDPGPKIALQRIRTNLIQKSRIDLLFVGKDWERKGGDIAIQVVQILQQRGIHAHLHIVGAQPIINLDDKYIHIYGLLDKKDHSQLQQLESLYKSCDLFIFPSSSEGYVIVVLEAAAYGLPVLAYDAMGVRDAVVDGKSGILLPMGSPPSAFADVIQTWINKPTTYETLVKGARDHYENYGNWHSCVESLIKLIKSAESNQDYP